MDNTTKFAGFDPQRLQLFSGRVLGDLASTLHAALCYIGDRLGLFRAMAGAGPVTAPDLAKRTGLAERYIVEWLGGMVAGEYVIYDAARATYELPAEHAAVLAQENGPAFMGGFIQMVMPTLRAVPHVMEAFRSGGGVAQDLYSNELFEAFERATGPTFEHQLPQWLGLVPEVAAKLASGATVLDVGCGSGRACVAIAKAFPNARVRGVDRHAPSIERARANAREAGVGERVTFDVADWGTLPRNEHDLVLALDIVHDAGDPIGLLTSIRNALTPDGTCIVQEINAAPRLEQNIGPIGKFLYAGSTLYCLNVSLADHGPGFGSLLGAERLLELAREAGFSRNRQVPVGHPLFAVFALAR